jgi:VanZ family protein
MGKYAVYGNHDLEAKDTADEILSKGGFIILENRSSIKNKNTLLRFTIFPFFYGILMELLQLCTPGRSGNFFDALADTAGIIISILLWMLLKPLSGKQSDLY